MRVLFTGGGTAGHLFPSVAVAQAVLAEEEAELLFVSSRHGLDAEILAQHGLPYEPISARPFPYGLSWRLFSGVWGLVRGAAQARRIITQFQPDVVMSSGGYVAAAVVPVASRRRVPIVAHVSDAYPDRTNRFLRRWATVITLAREEAESYFEGGECRVVGQPIREEFFATSREEGAAALGLDPERPVLLVTGGSQGARSLNRATQAGLGGLLAREGLQVLHVTGAGEQGSVVEWAESEGFLSHERYQVAPWVEMPAALAASDVVVMRAGASSLAEACACGGALVLVPYPHAGGHQRRNAAELEQVGAAVVIDDEELTGGRLVETVESLLEDEDRRETMRSAARARARPAAAREVARVVLELGRESLER